jgi:RNA polymerase sigma-B factor
VAGGQGHAVALRFADYRRTGDPGLRDELVLEHIGLARALARRYAGRGESLDDIQQVAMMGLVKAVDRFDPDRGLAFTTFAVPTITGEIKRHFRDRTWSTRVPRGLQELALRLGTTVRTLSQELGRSPSVAEIAEALSVDEEAVLEAMEVSRSYRAASLDAPAQDDAGRSRGEDALGRVDQGFESVERRMTVDHLLGTLSERDRTIIVLRFFGNKTQSEIAAEIGISQMHVSRLLARALERLHGVLAESGEA